MSDQPNETGKPTSINRRALLGGAAIVGGIAAAQTVLPSAAQAQALIRPTKTYLPNPNGFTVTAMGEAMVGRPFANSPDPTFQSLVKLMRQGDITYAHLETSLANDDELSWAARGSAGASGYLVTDGDIAKDFAAVGVDALSLGMNHSFDWGPNGIFATIKHVKAAGIAGAGIGKNLETARAPTYFQTPKGRAALISVSSGNSPYEWAGYGKAEIPGRPGVNPLRVLTILEVPKEAAAQLKSYGKSLGVMNDAAAAKPDFNLGAGAQSGSNGFSGSTFREGEKFAIHSQGNPTDMRGNLRAVAEARNLSNYVMVAHHNSTSEGSRSQDPSDFVIDFARKSIDTGADIYFGHGWHSFLGIEIYKGKPILYGMGSMFVQSQFMTRVPADQYESYGYDPDTLPTLDPGIGTLHPGGGPDWGWGALYQLNYSGGAMGVGRLREVLLYPVEMGWDYTSKPPRLTRQIGMGEKKYLAGDPRLATGANAQVILGMLRDVNTRRGTTMAIRNGVGVITVA